MKITGNGSCFKNKCKFRFSEFILFISILLIMSSVSCGKFSSGMKQQVVHGPTGAGDRPQYADGEVLLKLKSGLSENELDEFMVRNHIVALKPVNGNNASALTAGEAEEGIWYNAELEENVLVDDAMLSKSAIYEHNFYEMLSINVI